jgi:hypothetical protein
MSQLDLFAPVEPVGVSSVQAPQVNKPKSSRWYYELVDKAFPIRFKDLPIGACYHLYPGTELSYRKVSEVECSISWMNNAVRPVDFGILDLDHWVYCKGGIK